MKRIDYLCVLTLFLLTIQWKLAHGLNEESAETDETLDLHDNDFDSFIKSNPNVLVMFYAPWCGHCKRLKPIFSDVSKMLKENASLTETPILLAKVDVTQEKSMGEKYHISAFPTLKFFRNNNIYAYDGPFSDADAILKYLQKETKANWQPPKSMVVQLTKDNFTEWVESHNISLVKFYIQSCVHCQRLEPEFEKAAKMLATRKKQPIYFAQVDCNSEYELRDKYGVRGFPTMFIFRKGRHYDYNGGNQYHEIVEFMQKSLKSTSKEVKTLGEFKSYVKNPTSNYIIGFFNDENDLLYDSYLKFGSKYPDDFKMFHVFDHSEFEDKVPFKIRKPSIVVYYHELILSSKEPSYRVLDKTDATAADVENFIFRTSLPLVGVLNENNKKLIYKNLRPICYTFYEVDFGIELRKNTIYFRNKLVPLARKYNNISFVIGHEQENDDLIHKFSLQEVKGDVTLVCLDSKSRKYLFNNEDTFDTDEIEEFIEKFLKNQLKPHYKTETVPKDNSKKLVKTLVGTTFESTLEANRDKDTLIYFYKADNQECIEFEKIYTKLAKKYEKTKSLLFTKINKNNNEFPDEYAAAEQASSSVVVYMLKANTASPPVLFDYTKESTLEDLSKFIEDNKRKNEEL